MGLNPKRTTISSGEALWKGSNLLTAKQGALRKVRGNEISMIFQDPMTSLNPVHTIGRQLIEAVQLHEKTSKQAARRRALEMVKAVGIPRAETRLDDYPHQFSGGMRQRVMIALQRDFGSAIILITHDLGVVAETADDVMVMYAAKAAEKGGYSDIFYRAAHPYTWGLLGSLPRLAEGAELQPIPGTPPSLLRPPPGCRFHLRCSYAFEPCPKVEPPLEEMPGHSGHLSACHLDPQQKEREASKLAGRMMAEST